MEQAFREHERGNQDSALRAWNLVHAKRPLTMAWGIATYNSALLYKDKQLYELAIPRFQTLLPSWVDDSEPSPNLMRAYRNYRYEACVGISDCFEKLQDYDNALKYLLLARDRYPYQSWCGTCISQASASLNERIERIMTHRARRDRGKQEVD
jgi:tetratricopeptide (TPR) repeat protein